MIEFSVEGMRCGGCASAVTEAIRRLDPEAAVEVDLEAKEVRVASAAATGRLRRAIANAGYAARELG